MFLDKDCLQDGQDWLGGMVAGLVASMVFVPILSWTEHDQGSVGGLSQLGIGGFDRVSRPPLPLPYLCCTLSLPRSFSSVEGLRVSWSSTA